MWFFIVCCYEKSASEKNFTKLFYKNGELTFRYTKNDCGFIDDCLQSYASNLEEQTRKIPATTSEFEQLPEQLEYNKLVLDIKKSTPVTLDIKQYDSVSLLIGVNDSTHDCKVKIVGLDKNYPYFSKLLERTLEDDSEVTIRVSKHRRLK